MIVFPHPHKIRKYTRLLFQNSLGFFLIIFLFMPASAYAGNVTMRVEAENTAAQKKDAMEVRQDLPDEINKDDVIDTGGLELRFDEERSIYYLYAQVDLEPKQSKKFKVVVRDLWNVSDADFESIQTQIGLREESLKDQAEYDAGKTYAEYLISKVADAKAAQESQQGNVEERIESYRVTRQILNDLRQKTTLLDDFKKEAVRFSEIQKENRQIKLVIESENPGGGELEQDVELTHYLPEGIQPYHIVSTDGFAVRYDKSKGLYFVSRKVDFKANEKKRFQIVISDMWHFPEGKMNTMQETAETLAGKLGGSQYGKISAYLLVEIKKYLSDVRESQEKAAGIDDRIAVYSINTKRMDAVEDMLNQLRKMVEEMEKNKTSNIKQVIKTVTPDVATTWRLIYATLILLSIITVFFYALWWGQVMRKQHQEVKTIDTPEEPKDKK